MFIRNLIEDRVIKIVKDVLRDMPVVCKCCICVEDIACYVLNRIKPYYISSGRGILHMEKDMEPYLQDQADIYTLVMQGANIIMKRRKERAHALPQDGLCALEQEEMQVADEYMLNFPYIVGRVLDYISLKPKGGVTVNLYLFRDNQYQLTQMRDESWQNPYVIPQEFEGYFTFWPMPLRALNQAGHIKETVNFKLVVDDGEYEEEFSLDILSDKIIRHRIDTRHSYELTSILI